MQFAKLCQYFEEIEKTSKRLEKTELLKQIINKCEVGEIKQTIYLCLGVLRPKYDKLEFNLADKMVVRAIARAGGVGQGQVESKYKERGDLGEVVGVVTQRHSDTVTRSVGEVYEELVTIAEESGVGSQERKVSRLTRLLASVSENEAKYIVRMVLGKLRSGFADKTILDALSYIEGGDKSAREELENLYQMTPDVGELTKIVKEKGVQGARSQIKIMLGRPVMPALAQRLSSAKEMIEKMGKVIVEPKFDGTRVQIHFSREGFGKTSKMSLFEEETTLMVKTFTRNLDENSLQFPELVKMDEQVNAKDVILDCEAVGYEPTTSKLLPFQMTITRKRKHGVKQASGAVPLKFFVFDILYLDGVSLLTKPLWERRKILEKVIREEGPLEIDNTIVTEDAEELRRYHKEQLTKGLEGVVVKQYGGKYVPGRQGFNWVKFKEEEGKEGKLLDTLDVVVMGYYRGKGKRTGLGIGAFLVGIKKNSELRIQNSETGYEILTIAKIGTGLSDEQFRILKDKLTDWETDSMPAEYLVDKLLIPDRWVIPQVVVEVAADEITISPSHSSGYALRFPRLVRLRNDKDLAGVTTTTEITEIAGNV